VTELQASFEGCFVAMLQQTSLWLVRTVKAYLNDGEKGRGIIVMTGTSATKSIPGFKLI
jgi:hypothetical protein